jgi:hypothetical protein
MRLPRHSGASGQDPQALEAISGSYRSSRSCLAARFGNVCFGASLFETGCPAPDLTLDDTSAVTANRHP